MLVTSMAEGLRERKKQRTREDIAAAAMALFTQRGFDDVTVADVARAADVSEKTVFNYFPAKEDLVTHRGPERVAGLVEAIRALPPGASLLEPFRRMTMDFLDDVESGPVEAIVAVPRLVMGSATLRERLFIGWEKEAAELNPAVAAHLGLADDDLVAAFTARSLSWAHRLVFRAAFTRLLAGESQHVVAESLRVEAARVYERLVSGLA
jgi:AcrR family transcriptional regulator